VAWPARPRRFGGEICRAVGRCMTAPSAWPVCRWATWPWRGGMSLTNRTPRFHFPTEQVHVAHRHTGHADGAVIAPTDRPADLPPKSPRPCWPSHDGAHRPPRRDSLMPEGGCPGYAVMRPLMFGLPLPLATAHTTNKKARTTVGLHRWMERAQATGSDRSAELCGAIEPGHLSRRSGRHHAMEQWSRRRARQSTGRRSSAKCTGGLASNFSALGLDSSSNSSGCQQRE